MEYRPDSKIGFLGYINHKLDLDHNYDFWYIHSDFFICNTFYRFDLKHDGNFTKVFIGDTLFNIVDYNRYNKCFVLEEVK